MEATSWSDRHRTRENPGAEPGRQRSRHHRVGLRIAVTFFVVYGGRRRPEIWFVPVKGVRAPEQVIVCRMRSSCCATALSTCSGSVKTTAMRRRPRPCYAALNLGAYRLWAASGNRWPNPLHWHPPMGSLGEVPPNIIPVLPGPSGDHLDSNSPSPLTAGRYPLAARRPYTQVQP